MQPIRSNKMTSDTTAVNLFYSSSLCEAVEIEKEYTVGFEFNIINWNAIPKACSNLDKEGVGEEWSDKENMIHATIRIMNCINPSRTSAWRVVGMQSSMEALHMLGHCGPGQPPGRQCNNNSVPPRIHSRCCH